jgi:hypothetical protein
MHHSFLKKYEYKVVFNENLGGNTGRERSKDVR